MTDIHHIHVWTLTPDKRFITLHARLREDASHDDALRALRLAPRENFGFAHAPIQLERGPRPGR